MKEVVVSSLFLMIVQHSWKKKWTLGMVGGFILHAEHFYLEIISDKIRKGSIYSDRCYLKRASFCANLVGFFLGGVL